MNRLLRVFLFVITLSLISTFGFSQSQYANVSWRKTQSKTEKSKMFSGTLGDIDVIGTAKNGILFTIRKEIKYSAFGKSDIKYFIENYNSELGRMKLTQLEIEEKEDGIYNGILLHNDKLLLFTSFYNKKLKKDFLFMQELNKSTLAFVGEKKMVMEVDLSENPKPSKLKIIAQAYSFGLAGDMYETASQLGFTFQMKRSSDSSDVLVTYSLPFKKKENRKVNIALFGKNLELKAQKVHELAYDEDSFFVHGYEMDDKGTVYMKGAHKIDKDKYEKKLLSFSNELNDMKEYTFPHTDKEIGNMFYVFDDEQQIKVYGVYNKRISRKEREKGIYSMSINRESGKIENEKFTPLEEKYQEALEEGFRDFVYVRNFIQKEDGGVMMLIEDVSIEVKTTTNRTYNAQTKSYSTSTTSVTHFYYRDIIALNLAEDGTLEWSTIVSKKQYGVGTSTNLSFYQQTVGNKLYLVFPDHADNKHVESPEGVGESTYSRNAKVAMLAVVAIDLETGKATKEKVYGFLPKKDKEWVMPSQMSQISATEALIYAEGADTYKMGKITFKP